MQGGGILPRIIKQPDERKQDIINTARNLFFEKGYDKTTITDICNDLSISQGLIYHYFNSKTDILYSVFDEISNENAQDIKQIISQHNGSAGECLMEVSIKLKIPDNKYKKLLYSVKEEQGALYYIHTKFINLISPLLATIIERGNEDESWSCKYPKESAEFLLHGFTGCIVAPYNNQSEDINKRFEEIASRILSVKG